jgi:hypothetical protein
MRKKKYTKKKRGPSIRHDVLEKPDKTVIGDYPRPLRGLATNRYGGNQLQRERGFKGNTYGPASSVYIYTEEERAEYERILREKGELE